MREILFRGKDLAGVWHYGVPLVFTEDYVCITAPYTYNKAVQPETIGQYTGVTDKNGKKIFEGDIVKCTYIYDKGYGLRFEPKIEAVVFREGNFNPLYNCERNSFEVIGNIHDNPELLKGE